MFRQLEGVLLGRVFVQAALYRGYRKGYGANSCIQVVVYIL